MARNMIEVAVYKGDEFVCSGTVNECAAFRNVKPDTIRYYLTAAYQRKLEKRKGSRNPIHVIRLDGEDEDNQNT
ncbi:hypothetical protein [Metabacillus sp. SLBN-84]